MTPQQVEELVQSYPTPQDKKLNRQIGRLERMRNFYSEKIPEAPEAQSVMFSGFVSALVYSMAVLRSHHKLTKKLKSYSEGADDEKDNNTDI